MIEDIRDYEVPNDVRDWDYGQRYRVVFWDIDDPDWDKLNDPARPVVPPWSENPRRVVGARDVEEVLEWAHANAHGRLFQIYVESDRPPARCVRVYGVEPTDPDEAEEAERRWAELHRSPSS